MSSNGISGFLGVWPALTEIMSNDTVHLISDFAFDRIVGMANPPFTRVTTLFQRYDSA